MNKFSDIKRPRKYFKKLVNRTIEKIFGLKLYSIRTHGREDWFDIKKTGIGISTIFDVGANIGQSAEKFLDAFPNAIIFCFEPVRHLFEELKAKACQDVKMSCYCSAMGSKEGTTEIYLTGHETTSSLIKPEYFESSESVSVDTIDNFSDRNSIQRIDLLKVDVEGFDLEVLKGADRMLAHGNIIFILVEVGFHPGDKRHVLFDNIRDFLMKHGYYLFGIYDQELEFSGENRLRYANVCFSKGNKVTQ